MLSERGGMSRSRSLVVRGAPSSLLRRSAMKSHFGAFGGVTRVVLGEGSALVTFSSHSSASAARSRGSDWKGTPLDLEWADDDAAAGSSLFHPAEEQPPDEESLSSARWTYRTVAGDGVGSYRSAMTAADKLQVLEERDRELRARSGSERTLNAAQATRGTCPDMCPEKERYMRETRRMVACYEEGHRGEMDHATAVKQYSRSSADQEEPLPHELRPEPVLTMTMAYLITCIMVRIDEGEENLSDWYDFCWDRLRAVRKDIIQQQLCDLSTVTIVEQCARFHIACFDRLWGVKRKVFDEKINTENLMNCLQSLMHMYEDLGKQGITCPNEAEFNACMVLLKLSSGDLLWEYNNFPERLQFSEEMQKVVHIHYVYNNNMYAQFFKIVRETTYLNACLMQRFFTQVRSRALQTVIKAYCPPNKQGILPLKHIVESLKFDSSRDAVAFCEAYGLALTDSGSHLKIFRNVFSPPETRFEMKHPSSLVTEKRIPFPQAVVGSGSSLPVFHGHRVHSSFGPDSSLNLDAVNAADQEEKMLRDIVERQLLKRRGGTVLAKDSPEEMSVGSFYEEEDEEEDEFEEEREEPMGMEEEFCEEEEEDENVEEEEDEDEVVEEEEVDEEELESDREVDKNLEDMEFSETEDEDSFDSATAKMQQSALEVLASLKTPPATFKFEAPLFVLPKPKVEPLPSPPKEKKSPDRAVGTKRLRTSATPIVFRPSDSLPEAPPTPRKRKDSSSSSTKEDPVLVKLRKKLSENMKKVSARKYAKLWRKKVERIRISRKRSADLGLPFMNNYTPETYGRMWSPSRQNKSRNLDLSKRVEICTKSNSMVKAILDTDTVDKIDSGVRDIGRRVVEILARGSVEFGWKYGSVSEVAPVFWKLVLAVPENPPGCTFPGKLRRWAREAFCGGQDLEAKEWTTACGKPVYTSVSVVEGDKDLERAANLSTLVVITAPGWSTPAETKSLLGRLLSPGNVPVPVAVLTLGAEPERLDAGDLRSKTTVFLEAPWKDSATARRVFERLARNVQFSDVRAGTLSLVFEEAVEKFFDLLHEDSFLNEGLARILSEPNKVVRLYNALLDRLEVVVVRCSSSNLLGTASEFKPFLEDSPLFPDSHDTPEFSRNLKRAFDSMKAPPLLARPPATSWELFTSLKAYCEEFGCPRVLSKLIRIINPPDDEDSTRDLEDHLRKVRWLYLLEILVQERLGSDPNLRLSVAYSKRDLRTDLDSHWWMDTELVIEANKLVD